ncbi:hypothetical protein PUN28_008228 [Cardiocondyla obscurior]|uniref:Uncharacterized protein n=1 Tax=Cardiocondyla obscurior TaxID=286306 RepID=A0AAW2FYW7_9HYME
MPCVMFRVVTGFGLQQRCELKLRAAGMRSDSRMAARDIRSSFADGGAAVAKRPSISAMFGYDLEYGEIVYDNKLIGYTSEKNECLRSLRVSAPQQP